MTDEAEAMNDSDTRSCTCHPDDDRPIPCPRKFALRHCWHAAVLKETQGYIVLLKNQDRNLMEESLLGYMMRVRRVLED